MRGESKPMTVPLFRPEVIDAQRDSWLGGISLAQPVHLWVLAGFAGLAATLVVTLLFVGEYARRSKVAGRLIPNLGLSTVLSPHAGVVKQLFPEEGDRVEAGAPLMLVTVPRATASGADVQEVLAQAIDQQRESLESSQRSRAARRAAQEAGLRQQLATAKRELAQTEAQVATRGQQVAMARETLQRYQRLGKPYVSAVQLRQQEQSVLEQVSIQQELERAASTIRRQIAQLEQALRELPAERAEQHAALQRDLALLTQERIQQESGGELLIKAPVAGVVASRRVEPGQAVQAGQAVLTLLPDGSRLQAELFVPSRGVGFIDPGDRVLLRYQAYPYQKFGHHGGRVMRVSRSAIMPDVPVGTAATPEVEPYYRVLVALDRQTITAYGQPEPLRPGMLLDAHIMGETRKLYEWALEPLYSLRGMSGD